MNLRFKERNWKKKT